jgi:acetylornithine deacetylase/succinyl-diaminopimelate desuccinylase-like protein
VTGISGLPKCNKAGNVVNPKIDFKLSIRLPPTKDSKEALKFTEKILTNNPPYNSKVSIKSGFAGSGFYLKEFDNKIEEILKKSSKIYFGEEPRYFGEGGSIPLVTEFQQMYPKAVILVIGVLGPLSNAHGPNEFFHIPYAKKLLGSVCQILADYHKVAS